MKFIKKLIISTAIILVSFFLIKTHVFASGNEERINLTYVSYDKTKLEEVEMPLFEPIFDHDDDIAFSYTDDVVENHPRGVEIYHIPDARAVHYSFAGWAYYKNGVEYILRRNDRFFEDTTFYARWTPTTKFITYELNEGFNNLGNPKMFNVQSDITLKDPVKKGYEFLGWHTLEDKKVSKFTNGLWINDEGEAVIDSDVYDVKLTAKWDIKEITISFNTNEGSVVDSITQTYNTLIEKPADPEKEGYTFDGWYIDSNFKEEFIFDLMPEKDITLYAKWNINSYSITFMHGDKEHAVFSQNYNTPIIDEPAAPIKEGHNFSGWFTIDNELYTIPEVMPAEIVVVYAGWDINEYTITFVSNGGTEVNPITKFFDAIVDKPTDPEKTGHTFGGWHTNEDLTDEYVFNKMPAEDITLYAKWAKIVYTVQFVDYKEDDIKTDLLKYDSTVVAPADPNRSGFDFKGWKISGLGDFIYFDNYKVNDNVVFKPVYEVITYNVSYVLNGAIGENPNPSTYTIEYTPVVLKSEGLTKEGYHFEGWYLYEDFTGAKVTEIAKDSIGDKEFYAKWNINQYTVKFLGFSDVHLGDKGVSHGSTVIAPTAPNVTGYTFKGWDKSLENITEDQTIKAVYEINKYTVTFVDHDSTILDTQIIDHGSDAEAPDEPVRENYKFTGWSTNFTNITSNLTVKAEYVRNVYTVIFLDHDDTVITTQEVVHGSAATTPDAPDTKPGYRFLNWDTDFTNVKSDLTVKAIYTIKLYTVTFKDYNGTTILKTQANVEHGSAATAPSNPTRTGYTFNGWDVAFTNITSDLTVTATYKINTYIVTFKDHNGTVLKTQTVNYNTGATAPTSPTRTGYTFNGWDVGFAKITSNLTVTATYNINVYVVTFKDYDGTELKTQNVNYNTSATAPKNPTRTGYTFDDWDKEFAKVTSDLIVTATYNINVYVVTFKNYNGAVLKTQNVNYTANATAPSNPTRTGYTFNGWDVGFTNITSDLTVTATYKINTYIVTFKDHNGTVLKTQTVNYNTGAMAPTSPTRTGYTFNGWDVGFAKITSNLTVTATYTINKFTVTFKDHNGTILKTQDGVAYNTSATAPTNPTRTGYTFDGWDVDFTKITSNLTVTATYEINKFTVTFKDHSGTIKTQYNVSYNTSATAPTTSPTRTGYTFAGWDIPFSNVKSDLTVTAKWNVVNYTITFKSSFKASYQIADEFLDDFYEYLVSDGTITYSYNKNTFKHGSGNLGGFYGTWYSEYNSRLYEKNIKTGNNNYFLSSSKYQAKWLPLTNFMVDFVHDGNPGQHFWEDTYAGKLRLRQYFTSIKPAQTADWPNSTMRGVPSEIAWTITYNIESPTLNFKTYSDLGNNFDGWYTSNSGGSKVSLISKGTTGNKTYYARWKTKDELFNQFATDVKNVWVVNRTVQEIIENFATQSWSNDMNVAALFSYQSNKWKWVENQIQGLAKVINYSHYSDLNSKNAHHWRTNLEGFWTNNETIFSGVTSMGY